MTQHEGGKEGGKEGVVMWIGESVFNFMKRARCCQWCVEMLLVWCERSTHCWTAVQRGTVQCRLDEIRTEQNRTEQKAGVQNRRQEFRIGDRSSE